ncbi:MAG: plastocyanin/azurin family copper-binding protein [Robiginitomaculum sp.]|nr:plastocyanin/azurin family copper-binding protein [Robiginitomaculum sp.]
MRIIIYFALTLGVTGVAACAPGSAGAEPPPAQPVSQQAPVEVSAHIIEIHKMRFQTKLLNVKIGDTVTWTNKDIVPHTATASDKSWDSGRLNKGESFTLTITNQTKLNYFCLYHRQMQAKLVTGTTQ